MSERRVQRASLTRRNFLGTTAAAAVSAVPSWNRMPTSFPRVANPDRAAFPKAFLWGAGTSAYQVEGAASEDGRGPSIWDEFCRRPSAIWRGQSGEVACDHYHRFREDVAMMKSLGLRAYRFSISWPRILPEGRGATNSKGLDFYSRMVDELLRAGITPFAALFHWDLPLAVHSRGGWLIRDSADWFAEYAALIVRALSDRVKHWLTLNEPRSFIGSGYRIGEHAPGERLTLAGVLRAGHILLLAHGKAVQAIRADSRQSCQVGFSPDVTPYLPFPEHSENLAAAREATFAVSAEHFRPENWWRSSAWWIDPVIRGEYPADGLAAAGTDAPEIFPGDMEVMRQPLDFFAANIYGGLLVRAGTDGKPERVPFPAGWPITAFDWEVTPDALYWGPRWLFERYQMPILITENGLSCRDWVSLDGAVHDPQRIDFVARYLRALARAIGEGIPVLGYFHWSWLDNFEWSQGFKQRFGLVFVDYPTQKRIPKDSARWYAKVIASGGAILTMP